MLSKLTGLTIALLLLCIFCHIKVQAQSIDLSVNNPEVSIGKRIAYFEDSTAQLHLTDVQNIYKEGRFIKGSSDILNFGNISSAIWIQIPLKTTIGSANYLIIDAANIETVDCYIPADSGWHHYKAGSVIKGTSEVRTTNQYIFPLQSLKKEFFNKVWLRIKSRNIMLVPIKLARADNLYLVENTSSKITNLCFIGFLGALFIFHLFLYISIKDTAYLYYCMYILSLGIYTIGYLGGYSYLLGDSFRIFLFRYPHIFFSLGFAMSIMITNRFYNLRSVSMPLFRWTNILFVGLGIVLLISCLGFKAQAASGAQIFGLLVPLTLAATSIYAYTTERKAIVSLCAAWLIFVIGVVYYVLSLQGIIMYQSYSPSILYGAVLLEFMLLAIALGQRYQAILEKQRRIELENLKLIQTHNDELEQKVATRTKKLKEAINQLKASDEIKNKLFSIISHDLRTPFNSMLTILSSNNMELLNETELKLILHSNRDHFRQLKIMLDNLLHWAKSQMEHVKMDITNFDIIEMTQSLAAVYDPIAREKKIKISIEGLSESVFVIADKNHIQLVLRNLLDNAVKFTHQSGSIVIYIKKEAYKIHTTIENDSTYSDKHHLISDGSTIHSDTLKNEGLGLGLDLCEDYLNRNGSSLIKKTINGRISFGFELPCGKQKAI